MPMLDVSVALTNPYTQDSFDVHRKQEIVNSYGESCIELQLIQGVKGVVFPEGSNDLARRPEAELTTKTLVIITRFALRGESNDSNTNGSYQPDTVFWRGTYYIVSRVEDYSNFAAGFSKCQLTETTMVSQAVITR